MSLVSNKTPAFPIVSGENWRPNAEVQTLKARAKLYQDIRHFFAKRDVLEVDTPLLSAGAASDPHILAIETLVSSTHKKNPLKYYLQTSPEFAMKRLLAAELGSIFQLCKAFRDNEIGRYHNPEFTILEWYRLDFDHFKLMDEVDAFLFNILATRPAKRISYQNLFMETLNIQPHTASIKELENKAKDLGFSYEMSEENQTIKETLNKDDWLNILMTHYIEPNLGFDVPVMVYDYPASQAALARLSENSSVAERFEVYVQGIELANGYHELTDPELQLERFEKDLTERLSLNQSLVPIDFRLIEALKSGLPHCSGIALGVDRLLMLKLNASSIAEVMAFTIERA
jgi:elongation factor P--(R)-beta-lysine ligase